MKIILFFLLVLASPAFLSGEGYAFTDIYNQNYKGVVLIEEGVFVRSTSLKNFVLFKKIEQLISKKIVDEYYCFAKGSGFIVSQYNYLVTNQHVLSYTSLENKRIWLFRKFVQELMDKLPPGYLTKNELGKVTSDFKQILEEANFELIVRFYDESYAIPTVLFSDADADIALLKADVPHVFPVLKFSEPGQLHSGQEIAALGFPLQNLIKDFLIEFKATFTTGVVSAVRNDKWGIQHTAPINPGNSGGPLINREGRVVGVNVGQVREANNLFFAISIDRCIKSLKANGYHF